MEHTFVYVIGKHWAVLRDPVLVVDGRRLHLGRVDSDKFQQWFVRTASRWCMEENTPAVKEAVLDLVENVERVWETDNRKPDAPDRTAPRST